MSDRGKPDPAGTDEAIRAALESVERIQREREQSDASGPAADETVEILPADDSPPAGPRSPALGPDEDDAPVVARKPSGQDVMLEAMIKAKNEMAEVLKQTQKEAKDMFDRLARVSADFENFKKRQTRERLDAVKFANEGMVKDIIPVLDNMNRALQSSEKNEPAAVIDGVKLVAKSFEDILGRFGVHGFTALGTAFDPARMEAVGGRDDPTAPAGKVIEEFQRGYMLHDRLVRPALVIVSSGPGGKSAEGPGEGPADDDGNGKAGS